jgi:hypothetical protein
MTNAIASANGVELNHFVKRQTRDSRFSHYEPTSGHDADTWAELQALIARHFDNKALLTPLKDNGLILKLSLPQDACKGFFSGVILVDEETVIKTIFSVRDRAVPGELPFIHSVAVNGRKAPASHVEVILYHVSEMTEEELTYIADDGSADDGIADDVTANNGSGKKIRQTGEWQVVSVNARDTAEPEPPTPMAMARNMAAALNLPEGVGGSARTYTAEQFVQAIQYWSRRTMSEGK